MSTIDARPPAIRTGETVRTGKSALVLAAVFIVVEVVLMAETIVVVLVEGSEHRNPAAPIAFLLSTALLANLGLVCAFIAGSAADAVRRSRRAEGDLASFAAVSSGSEDAESMAGYISAVDVVGPATTFGTAASSDIPTSG